MEIEVLVDADPVVDNSQKRYRAASAFFTYVSLSQEGKSLPVPQLVVSVPLVVHRLPGETGSPSPCWAAGPRPSRILRPWLHCRSSVRALPCGPWGRDGQMGRHRPLSRVTAVPRCSSHCSQRLLG